MWEEEGGGFEEVEEIDRPRISFPDVQGSVRMIFRDAFDNTE